MADASFRRTLGLWDATFLVSGSMIGSGIFIVSADMLRYVGGPGWMIALWVFSGFLTLLAALCYGELAGMMPQAGGQFIYIKNAFGRLPSFLYGWTVFTVIQTGVIAAVAVAFSRFIAVFFPALSPDRVWITMQGKTLYMNQITAIAMILFLTFMNARGVENGKLIQKVFTSSKIIALLFLVAAGLIIGAGSGYLEENFLHPFEAFSWKLNDTWVRTNLDGFGLLLALGMASIGALFSSDAWNNVTFVAGEIKAPEKNIPKSLLLGVGMVTLLYVLVNVSYLCLLPAHGLYDAQSPVAKGIAFAAFDRVGTAAAHMIMGEPAVYFIAVLIVISTFGCNNGIILSGARVYYAMAQEKLFAARAGKLNRFGVPAWALYAQAGWASVLTLSGSYGDLLDYTTFASLLFYILTISGIFVLRKNKNFPESPFRVHSLLPVIYILLATLVCMLLLIAKPHNTLAGLFIVGLGLPVYFFFFRQKKESPASV